VLLTSGGLGVALLVGLGATSFSSTRVATPLAGAAVTAPTTTTVPTTNPFAQPISSFLATRHNTVSVAFEDLETGQITLLGSQEPQFTASMSKLDIAETLVHEQKPGAPIVPTGLKATVASMLEWSDNDAAVKLWKAVGNGPAISAFNEAIGMDATQVPYFEAFGRVKTTPHDQLILLSQLLPDSSTSLLSSAQRTYVLTLLSHVVSDQRWGVSGGMPAGATADLKNGWVPLDGMGGPDWQVNSAGWVHGGGVNFLLAVMTTGNQNKEYGVATIDGVAKIIERVLAAQRTVIP
jgi:hypothetical protein